MYNNTENIFLSLDITPNSDLNFLQDKPYQQSGNMMSQQIKSQIPQVKSEVDFFDLDIKEEEQNTKSGNRKNAFIKKINSLMNLQTTETNKVQFIQTECQNIDKMRDLVLDGNSNKSQKKLQKNRDTARISRMRKKYYIDLLEKKLEQMTEEVYYQSQNQTNSSEKVKIKENDQVMLVKYTQQDMLNKVQMSLFDNNFSESQVLLVLESYQSKIGPNGFFRKMLIDGLLDQLKHNYLPQGMKTILKNSNHNIFSEFQPELQQISSNYQMLIQQLEQTKTNYLQTNKQIEDLVNEVITQQKPSQIAQFILNHNQIDKSTENQNKEWFFSNLLEKSQELEQLIIQNNDQFQKNLNQINDTRFKKIKLDEI